MTRGTVFDEWWPRIVGVATDVIALFVCVWLLVVKQTDSASLQAVALLCLSVAGSGQLRRSLARRLIGARP